MSDGEYSVYQFFPDDSYEAVLRLVDGETAVKMAKQLSESVGGRIGTTRRIMITDGGDCCVFEWHFDKGVVWPDQKEESQ
jgi:hypothetical protein